MISRSSQANSAATPLESVLSVMSSGSGVGADAAAFGSFAINVDKAAASC